MANKKLECIWIEMWSETISFWMAEMTACLNADENDPVQWKAGGGE